MASSASLVCSLFYNRDNVIITGLDEVSCARNHEKYSVQSVIPNWPPKDN